MKELFILPGITDLNRGDQALVWESINLFKEKIKESHFVLFQSGYNQNEVWMQSRQSLNHGHEVVGKLLNHPSRILPSKDTSRHVNYSFKQLIFWGFQASFDLFASLLLLSKFKFVEGVGAFLLPKDRKKVLDRFKRCHCIVVKGGGFLHSYGKLTDLYTLYYLLFPILLGIRNGRKIIILPNSIGPIKSYFGQKLVRYCLQKCTLVTVREIVSKGYLESLGIKSKCYPDLGFYLSNVRSNQRTYLLEKGIPVGQRPIIGFTLRPYRFPGSKTPEQNYKKYLDEILDFIAYLITEGNNILIIAHTLGPSVHEDDRIAISNLKELIPEEIMHRIFFEENFDHSCYDIMAIYSELDMMVGTRFHSVIFSLNVEVPCIAIGYGGNKSFGIMNDLGLQDHVFPIEDFTSGDLIRSYETILLNKSTYLEKIRKFKTSLERYRIQLQEDCLQIIGS